jgi:hypothetical protein
MLSIKKIIRNVLINYIYIYINTYHIFLTFNITLLHIQIMRNQVLA